MEKQLKEKLKHLEDRHKAERNAVVRLQHQLRHKVLDVTSSGGGGGNDDDDDEKTRSKTSQNLHQQFGPAIARAQSCFSRRAGTPRQGGSLVASARCRLHFDVEFVPKRSLEGLEVFSRVGDLRVSREHERVRDEERRGGESVGLRAEVERGEARVFVHSDATSTATGRVEFRENY